MGQTYNVEKTSKLLPFLFEKLDGWSKKTVKQRLKESTVAVNGTVTTKHDFFLKDGDIVEVGVLQNSKASRATISNKSLNIIYQDNNIIAINKPAGLLSVGTSRENKEHALALLRKQLSKKNERLQLYPVHRLDRDTSGVLLFATSKELRETVMGNWKRSKKVYLAIVEGVPKSKNGTINQPLRLDEEEYKVHVGKHPNAKEAITHYKTLEQKNSKSLLEVTIETGRQHQIRAHLSWLGTSVVNDERYGKKVEGKRMGLHAKSLSIIHPISKKSLELKVDAPSDFYGLF